MEMFFLMLKYSGCLLIGLSIGSLLREKTIIAVSLLIGLILVIFSSVINNGKAAPFDFLIINKKYNVVTMCDGYDGKYITIEEKGKLRLIGPIVTLKTFGLGMHIKTKDNLEILK